MTRAELITMMEGTGVYFDPDHPDHIERSKVATLPPPFMEFYIAEIPFSADDIVYYTYNQIVIRLFCDTDIDDAETAIKAVIADYYYRVSKEYDDDLGLWMTTYALSTKEG